MGPHGRPPGLWAPLKRLLWSVSGPAEWCVTIWGVIDRVGAPLSIRQYDTYAFRRFSIYPSFDHRQPFVNLFIFTPSPHPARSFLFRGFCLILIHFICLWTGIGNLETGFLSSSHSSFCDHASFEQASSFNWSVCICWFIRNSVTKWTLMSVTALTWSVLYCLLHYAYCTV